MKMPIKIENSLLSRCVFDCLSCPCYLRKDNPCKGCLKDAKNRNNEDCPIIDCLNDKHLMYCYECEEFPCPKYLLNCPQAYKNDLSLAKRAVQTIKNKGLDFYMKNEKIKNLCKHCHSGIVDSNGRC